MKTFEQLVEANKFGWTYINSNYKPQPVAKDKVKIELWHPDKVTTNQEFLDHCKETGARPATFNEALQFALDNPDEQKKYPLVTYDSEQLCYLGLDFDDDGRGLGVRENDPDDDWGGNVRFLAVPAPAGAPASSLALGNSELFDLGSLVLEYKGRKFKLTEVK